MLFNSISRWKLTWQYCLYHVQRLALKRLTDISMGVITPLSEQLTKPLPNAMVLVNLKELSSGAYKLLPEGTSCTKKFSELSELSILNSHGLVTNAFCVNSTSQARGWLCLFVEMNLLKIWKSLKMSMPQCFSMIYHIQRTKSAEYILPGGIILHFPKSCEFTFLKWVNKLVMRSFTVLISTCLHK